MIGFNLLLWTADPGPQHRPLLNALKDIGYGLVEVPIFHRDEAKCAALASLLDELGLARSSLSARGADDNPVSPDPAVRRLAVENGKREVDCALALGATRIVGPLHSGFGVHSGGAPTRAEWDHALRALDEVATYARRHGVSLSLEFLNRFECYLLNTTEETARFVRELGAENVGILYDTHHAHIEDGDIGETLCRHGALINHVHLSESHRGAIGRGMVRWPEVFAALKQIRYGGDIVVEAFGTSVAELIPLVKIWRKAYDTEETLARDAYSFIRAHAA